MNSMPFRQLKSFLKILIGVQYEKREIHTVFLRFPNFELSQKSRLGLLAKLRGVALIPKERVSIIKRTDPPSPRRDIGTLIFYRRCSGSRGPASPQWRWHPGGSRRRGWRSGKSRWPKAAERSQRSAGSVSCGPPFRAGQA